MPAPYADSSYCAEPRPRRQAGAALLLAMLLLALMAEIATLVVTDYGSAMDLLVGRQDHAQSRWLARGAIDWARNVLSEDKKVAGTIDYLGEIWATRVPPTAVEDGEVAGEIVDYSGYFNLNGVIRNGAVDSDQVDAYQRLLQVLGIPQQDAMALSAALVDWIDVNDQPEPGGAETAWYAANGRQYQAANAPLVDIDELKLIRGYNDDIVSRLRTVAAALPEAVPVNVNTAPPEVLVALVKNLSIDDARALAARRLTVPFKDVQAFHDQLPGSAVLPGLDRIAVISRYFLAGGRAKYGQAVTRMQVLLDRQSNWSTIVWQKVL